MPRQNNGIMGSMFCMWWLASGRSLALLHCRCCNDSKRVQRDTDCTHDSVWVRATFIRGRFA